MGHAGFSGFTLCEYRRPVAASEGAAWLRAYRGRWNELRPASPRRRSEWVSVTGQANRAPSELSGAHSELHQGPESADSNRIESVEILRHSRSRCVNESESILSDQ